MKLQVKLRYKGTIYVSDQEEATEEQYKQLVELLKTVKPFNFHMKINGHVTLFGPKITEKSIITIYKVI
jgi:hypothetical protein